MVLLLVLLPLLLLLLLHLCASRSQATLSGALDIVAVRQDDGSIKCTPFHVRCGAVVLHAPSAGGTRCTLPSLTLPSFLAVCQFWQTYGVPIP